MITPALEGPLTGSLYIGAPLPNEQYRVFMIFEGFGLFAKIAAAFHPDPTTGQLTLSVPSLPQVPFEQFNLHLFASDRGLIATATHCSTYSVTGTLTPWNSSLAPQSVLGTLSVTTAAPAVPARASSTPSTRASKRAARTPARAPSRTST